MVWAWVFLAIGVAGLVVAISYGVWLLHKAADVYAEIKMLSKRGEEISDLLNQLELNPTVHRETALVTTADGAAAVAHQED